MSDEHDNLAPVAPLRETQASAADTPVITADSMEGVVVETSRFDNNGDGVVDPLFEEQPGEGESTDLIVIKDGDDGDEGEEHDGNGVLARIKRQTYADFLSTPTVTINVGDIENDGSVLSAHQAFLLRSPYLAGICSSYTHDVPASERVVNFPDEDLDAVGCFLQYLYTDEYSPRLVPNPQRPDDTILEALDPDLGVQKDLDGGHLLKHAKIYTLAEKLGMEELKTLAHAKIHKINSTAKGELEYARFVYANTPREDKTIRTPIATYWAHKSHVLRHEAEDEFRGMILEFPQFAYDMLSIVLDQKEKKNKDVHREEREGTEIMAPPGTAEKTRGSARKRPRTSSII
ncbi:hypothetical protein B9Z19DRAFT_1104000 [Tuber borchii]|uniref:BTB domain-containing protein n=1 Tax=Tuber borchii TaxID=42251 RepID=A0A2T6ZCP8_TUBBO|nr:hypothetical protein B9Z19DRAFT_1104000 [Tuber borchii]